MVAKLLIVVDEPDEGTATVVRKPPGSENKKPYFKGGGEFDFRCGLLGCGTTLLSQVHPKQATDIVFEFFECGSFNYLEAPSHVH